ncbi:MAG: type II toxin-antitoxin system RelE/ParE family toxin [Rhizobiales bacterium]|nr:type II toxin-antitoxin system RelE/ParE family toxin [Hyphomicrobiales bacterium]
MIPVVFAPRAALDIEEIFDYTADRWSVDQAELYVLQIKKAVETLATDPLRGRPCDDVRPGHRRYPVGTHTIFYRLIGSSLTIVRVLHQQMDIDQHL